MSCTTGVAQAEVFAFLSRALPFTFLSAVVMQELAAGARTTDVARDVQLGAFEPFELRRRVFAPPPIIVGDDAAVLSAFRTALCC